MKRRIESLAWAACLIGLASLGAPTDTPPEYVAQSWQRQHGLPENMVKALCQTRDGYLWIGTYSGLARDHHSGSRLRPARRAVR